MNNDQLSEILISAAALCGVLWLYMMVSGG